MWESGELATEFETWNEAVVECLNDDTVSDSYGDTCSNWYNGDNIAECGNYDTDTFIAAEACCNCM